MKKHSIVLLVSVLAFTNALSQIKNSEIMTFQNVKTESINVDGTVFYYRKLGTSNE